jgi:hypothetical protein
MLSAVPVVVNLCTLYCADIVELEILEPVNLIRTPFAITLGTSELKVIISSRVPNALPSLSGKEKQMIFPSH